MEESEEQSDGQRSETNRRKRHSREERFRSDCAFMLWISLCVNMRWRKPLRTKSGIVVYAVASYSWPSVCFEKHTLVLKSFKGTGHLSACPKKWTGGNCCLVCVVICLCINRWRIVLVWWVSQCHAVQCQHNLFHPYFLRFSLVLYPEFKDLFIQCCVCDILVVESGNACCTSNNHQNLEAFLFVLCKTEYLIRHNTMSSFPSPYFATFLTLPTTLPGWLCWQPIHTLEGFN